MIETIITTLVGAVLLAVGTWTVKSRWLYVIAPKMHLITPLSNGQIVSLSIHNAGLLTEDDIKLTMRPSCTFELVATSKSTVSILNKTISIPKLIKSETVTVLLLVEGRQFEHQDIESIESKATHGKVVEKKENAVSLLSFIVALPVLMVVMAVPFVLGNMIGADTKKNVFAHYNERSESNVPSKQLANYKVVNDEYFATGTLEDALKKGRIRLTVKEALRRGDIITLSVNIWNGTGRPLMAEGYVTGPAGKGPLDFWAGRVEEFAIGVDETKLVTMKVYIPEAVTTKMTEGRYSFKSLESGSLTISQRIQFD